MKMKKFIIIFLVITLCLLILSVFTSNTQTENGSSNNSNDTNTNSDLISFKATVVDKNESNALIIKNETDKNSNRELISLTIDDPNIDIGDKIEVLFDGNILETYPAQISATNITKLPTNLPLHNKFVPLTSLSMDYKPEEAEKEGCVVFYSYRIANEKYLNQFVKNVENKTDDFIRIALFTTEGDLILKDIIYENSFIKIKTDSRRDKFSSVEDQIIASSIFDTIEISSDKNGTSVYAVKSLLKNIISKYESVNTEADPRLKTLLWHTTNN